MVSGSNEICSDVLTAIRRIIRAIELRSRKMFQQYGLTGPQFVVLKELENPREITVGEIAVNVSLSSATVTDILGRLEKRGLVERTRSDRDKRRVLVKATEDGLALLQSAPPLLQEQFVNQFQQLEEWEQHQILASVQRIVGMMDVGELDASAVLTTGAITDEPADPENAGKKQPA